MFTAVAENRSPTSLCLRSNKGRGWLACEPRHAGKHFNVAWKRLHFGRILGILPVRNVPGTVLVYGTDGAALSTDLWSLDGGEGFCFSCFTTWPWAATGALYPML